MDPGSLPSPAWARAQINFDPLCLGDAEDKGPIVIDWRWSGFLAGGENAYPQIANSRWGP
jgi:hypothetical protein